MKITQLKVDGFGVWSGLSLGELSDGLNVFYGPNEAGKTTLMQFVRSVFFGFSPDRRARYIPPVHGGRPGGTIHALAGNSDWTITRHALDDHVETCVVSQNGQPLVEGERSLATLLGKVDEPTFNHVFVCGLRDLQELATLSDTQAAEELYSLALGLDRISLGDVLKELATSRQRLLSDDDRPSLIGQLLSQRQRLEGDIDELGQATTRYLTIASERRQLDGEIARLESDTNRWDEQSQRLSLAMGLSERWRRRGDLEQQLQSLAVIDGLPQDALPRFENLEAGLAALARRAVRLKRKRRQIREEIAALKINDALRRQQVRLEALAEQQHWIESLEKQVASLEADIGALETNTKQDKQQWGVAGNSARQLAKHDIDEMRAAARALHRARREAEELHQHTSRAEQQAADTARQVESALGKVKDKGLTQSLAEAGQLVADLRKRVQLDERITQMSTREGELEEQGHERLEEQNLPSWVLAGLGSLFVLGCGLVLLFVAGLVMPATLGDSLTWPVGLLGILASGVAAGFKWGLQRTAESRLDSTHRQISVLGQQLKAAQAERDELDARLPRGGGPLVARLQAAEKQLAQLETLVPLEAQREHAAREADAANREAQAIRDRCRDTRKRWQQLLNTHGLPADLSPKQLKAFALARRRLGKSDAAIVDQKADLARRRAELATISGRIGQVVTATGIKPRSQRPLEQLQQCLAELADQQRLLKQRDEFQAQIAQLHKRFLRGQRQRRKLRAKRLWLLRAAGTLEADEFRRRAAMQADIERVKAEHARLHQEISAALTAAGNEQISEWLGRGDNLEPLVAELTSKRRVAEARLNEARERRGAINQQWEAFADDRQLTDKQLELDVINERLAEALDRWRVLAVCQLVLHAVRDYYEREHQPQALRDASDYLNRLTNGRYRRVWTPLGEHALLVDDEHGHSLSVEVLSTATREQVFLALRLALVSAFARRGLVLPLVLDDVLVNFDITRAKAAAVVLRDFAKSGHQVLVFTCHEHIARLFKNVKADVRQLPDRFRNLLDEAPRKPKRIVEEPPVEEPAPIEEPPVEEPLHFAMLDPVVVETDLPLVMVAVELPPPIEPVVEALPPVIAPQPVIAPPVVIAPPSVMAPSMALPVIPPPLIRPPVMLATLPAITMDIEPPPLPKPQLEPRRPVRGPRRRAMAYSREWNAEEFDGELSDRVRRDLVWDEVELVDDSAAA